MPRVFIVHDHVLDPMLAEVAQDLQALGVEVVRGPRSVSGDKPAVLPDDFMASLKGADVAMFSSRSICDRATLAACSSRLRAVINPTIGVETVDVAAASEMGILVGNGATPENYQAMAEASVMLMLNLFFGLRKTERQLRENLPRPALADLHQQMIRGKTIGVIGMGNIGRALTRLLVPFGAKLLAHSPQADPAALPAEVRLVGLDELLQASDLVCVCIAVTPQNRQVINQRTLGLMKPSAYLVNVSRGDAIDEPALVRALETRQIAGAALDTFVVEPLPLDSPLRRLDNVILTPHAVGYTRDGFVSLRGAAVENIRRVLEGRAPLYCKNPAALDRWSARVAAMEPLRTLASSLQGLAPVG